MNGEKEERKIYQRFKRDRTTWRRHTKRYLLQIKHYLLFIKTRKGIQFLSKIYDIYPRRIKSKVPTCPITITDPDYGD